MKKSLLIFLVPTLLLGGCLPAKKGSTTNPTTIEPSSNPTSVISSSATPIPSSSSSSSSSGSSPTSSSTPAPEPPVIQTQTISTIKEEGKVGELVKFEATYLRRITLSNTCLMYFADIDNYICLRIPQTVDYFNNRYRFKEYLVMGILAETEDGYEVQYDTTYTPEQTVTNLGDSYPLSFTYDSPMILKYDDVEDVMEYTRSIVMDTNKYGVGKVVKFTAQVSQTEYEKANTKVMVLDKNGYTTSLIADDQKFINEEDIGKTYTWYGITSIEKSVPAVLYLHYENPQAKSEIDVSKATKITCADLNKWNLLSDRQVYPTNDDYFKLYYVDGYIQNNMRNEKYYLGFVDNPNDSLAFSGKDLSKGFYFVNGQNLDDRGSFVKKVADYYNDRTQVRVYVGIRAYNNNLHAWNMFCIEDLITPII